MKSSGYGALDPTSRKLPKSVASLPLHEKTVRWPRRDRIILMGTKATSGHRALAAARGQYPVYCQRIGRRIHRPVLCSNENTLTPALFHLDWRTEYVIIRKVH